jgi:hypothetical protein
MKSLELLARRRAELLAISTVQRQSLQLERDMWRARLSGLMLAGNAVARIRANPLLVGTLALSIMLIRPGRIQAGLQKFHATWQTIRVFLPLIMPLLRRNQVK